MKTIKLSITIPDVEDVKTTSKTIAQLSKLMLANQMAKAASKLNKTADKILTKIEEGGKK